MTLQLITKLSCQIGVWILADWPTDRLSPTCRRAEAERAAPRCWPHENHSHAEFISAVVTQNHGWNFNNCRPQLSKQLHWNLIPVDFSFVLCQRRVLIRPTKTTRVPALMDVRGEEGQKEISGWTRTCCWGKKKQWRLKKEWIRENVSVEECGAWCGRAIYGFLRFYYAKHQWGPQLPLLHD